MGAGAGSGDPDELFGMLVLLFSGSVPSGIGAAGGWLAVTAIMTAIIPTAAAPAMTAMNQISKPGEFRQMSYYALSSVKPEVMGLCVILVNLV